MVRQREHPGPRCHAGDRLLRALQRAAVLRPAPEPLRRPLQCRGRGLLRPGCGHVPDSHVRGVLDVRFCVQGQHPIELLHARPAGDRCTRRRQQLRRLHLPAGLHGAAGRRDVSPGRACDQEELPAGDRRLALRCDRPCLGHPERCVRGQFGWRNLRRPHRVHLPVRALLAAQEEKGWCRASVGQGHCHQRRAFGPAWQHGGRAPGVRAGEAPLRLRR
mmetsp:Transcript_103154/g.308118  ORF Transcript_103154/g.308118 Transcript_103154/m.308118 type:complete len:218 (+) Transcript_103154:689-1342(+)